MFGIETLEGPARAVALVGVVAAEAMLLYVGYGVLERVLGPVIARVLVGDCPLLRALRGGCPTEPDPRGERQ